MHPGNDLVGGRDTDAGEARPGQAVPVFVEGQRPGDAPDVAAPFGAVGLGQVVFGEDVGDAEAAAGPEAGEFYMVEGAYPDGALPPLMVAITGAPQDPPKEADPATGPDPVGGPAAADTSTPLPQRSRTFNLLLGVELPVSVSFGHVQLPLKDVLKLTAGSIIELNRTVDEPVEVIVNNCVVARGEVVVVEGNYGVRIHQIMSRQERLEALP